MNLEKCEIVMNDTISIIATIISVLSLGVSIYTYWYNFNKQKKIDTLNELAEIRIKYPNFSVLLNEQKYEYVQRMEIFALGVHEGIYDLDIVKKMSRKRLLSQYEEVVAKYFNENNIKEYSEYRNLMEEIK